MYSQYSHTSVDAHGNPIGQVRGEFDSSSKAIWHGKRDNAAKESGRFRVYYIFDRYDGNNYSYIIGDKSIGARDGDLIADYRFDGHKWI